MTLKSTLTIFGVWTIIAALLLIFVVFTVPPKENGVYAEGLFFGSLLLVTVGTMTILGVIGRMRNSSELASNHLAPAFRQGFLIALAMVAVLLLQRFRVLLWWNLLLLGIILVLVDLIFASAKRPVSPDS